MLKFQPRNERVAMVFCPMWSNVPPIALAYIKGAVRNRRVDCIDLNLDMYRSLVADYRHVFEAELPAISRFYGNFPNFDELEAACELFERTHESIVAKWADRLSGSFLITASDRIRKLGESSIEDTVPWLRGGKTDRPNAANRT